MRSSLTHSFLLESEDATQGEYRINPRTDTERLETMIQNGWHFEAPSQGNPGWELWDNAGAIVQIHSNARKAIDAAMDTLEKEQG